MGAKSLISPLFIYIQLFSQISRQNRVFLCCPLISATSRLLWYSYDCTNSSNNFPYCSTAQFFSPKVIECSDKWTCSVNWFSHLQVLQRKENWNSVLSARFTERSLYWIHNLWKVRFFSALFIEYIIYGKIALLSARLMECMLYWAHALSNAS